MTPPPSRGHTHRVSKGVEGNTWTGPCADPNCPLARAVELLRNCLANGFTDFDEPFWGDWIIETGDFLASLESSSRSSAAGKGVGKGPVPPMTRSIAAGENVASAPKAAEENPR